MWYYKLNFWFTSRVFFYNCCFTFLSLAIADPYSTLFVFLTGGFITGTIAQKILHQPEEYVFQNLGISNLQRYGFAYIMHVLIAFIAFVSIYILINYA
jgi:hypothetical protein